MKKQIFHILLLLIIPYFTACQQNVKVEVKDNCIYVNGKKILEGDSRRTCREAIYIEKQNKIVYIMDSMEKYCDDIPTHIYTYDMERKEIEKIVDYVGYGFSDLVEIGDCLYFKASWPRYPLGWKYSFSTGEINTDIGYMVENVITEGEYQNCIVATFTKNLPYDHCVYYERWILDSNENQIGCLGYEFEEDFFKGTPHANTEFSYDNITLVEPLHFELAKDWETWYGLAKNGLSYIQQYQRGDKSVEDEIENIKNECDYYGVAYSLIIYDEHNYSNELSQQQKEQLKEIKRFLASYKNYK
ncbi:hypothetical protein LJC68_02725 [Bacteroidales bacterium OttesenSCG-928-B11]|nr:hypothetical protein [Bacteroidales bacterium OttesenSCG-928-C03]MDL2311777.1 hypothetical protein [Bacteroidales bacterium OttesenSCG-928-B11]